MLADNRAAASTQRSVGHGRSARAAPKGTNSITLRSTPAVLLAPQTRQTTQPPASSPAIGNRVAPRIATSARLNSQFAVRRLHFSSELAATSTVPVVMSYILCKKVTAPCYPVEV